MKRNNYFLLWNVCSLILTSVQVRTMCDKYNKKVPRSRLKYTLTLPDHPIDKLGV